MIWTKYKNLQIENMFFLRGMEDHFVKGIKNEF